MNIIGNLKGTLKKKEYDDFITFKETIERILNDETKSIHCRASNVKKVANEYLNEHINLLRFDKVEAVTNTPPWFMQRNNPFNYFFKNDSSAVINNDVPTMQFMGEWSYE